MEKEYKDKILQSEEMETNLRAKILQLEKRLVKDTEYAQERIVVLEEKQKVCKINRDTKDHNNLKEEHKKLQAFVNLSALLLNSKNCKRN